MKCKGIKKECDIVATTHFFFVLVFYHPISDGSGGTIKIHTYFDYFPSSGLIGYSIPFTVDLRQRFFRCTIHFKFKYIK